MGKTIRTREGLKKGHTRGRGVGEAEGAEGTGEAGGKRAEEGGGTAEAAGPKQEQARQDMGAEEEAEGEGRTRLEERQGRRRGGGRRDSGRRATGRRDRRAQWANGGRKGSNSEGAGRDR